MKHNELLSKYKINYQKLFEYGFIRQSNNYCYSCDTSISGLTAQIIISEECIESLIIDEELNEEYIPYNLLNTNSSTVSKLKDFIQQLLDDIVEKCFENSKIVARILEYVYKTYETIPDNPFSEPGLMVLRNSKDKWYGLIMDCNKKHFKADEDYTVTVINLKHDNINNPVYDNHHIFKAYHMSKKHWISVILDEKTDFTQLMMLIDESYSLVKK